MSLIYFRKFSTLFLVLHRHEFAGKTYRNCITFNVEIICKSLENYVLCLLSLVFEMRLGKCTSINNFLKISWQFSRQNTILSNLLNKSILYRSLMFLTSNTFKQDKISKLLPLLPIKKFDWIKEMKFLLVWLNIFLNFK